MKNVNKMRCICTVLLFAMLLSGCASKGEENNEPKGKSYFTYFDTVTYVFSYAGDSTERFDDRSAEVSALLSSYHKLFDIYHEYADTNNLCTVNKNAGGAPVEVDPLLIEFLQYAKTLCEQTDGAMDITLGAVLSIWHDHREAASDDPENASVPELSELEEAAKHTGFDLLEINEEDSTVRLTDPKASIDVGALGKGYATEMAALMLQADEAYGYVLNVGGNIRTVGTKPDGTKWSTGIRNPKDDATDFALRIEVADTACVTSGVYERFFMVDGVRYHHIIDPDTLFPATYYDSVTVIAKSSAIADALSTALFCLPYDESRALAEKMGADAVWIFPDGSMEYTDAVASMIV